MKRLLLAVMLLAALAASWWYSQRGPSQARIDEVVAQARALEESQQHLPAAELYGQAAELCREAGDETAAIAWSAQRGVCLKLAGRTAEAREIFLESLADAQRRGDDRMEGLSLGNLARVEGLDGHDDLARDYLARLATLAQRIEDPRLEVLTREQVAVVSLDLGDAQRALGELDAALAANAANSGEDDRRDPLLRQRAMAQLALGDDEGAVASWAQASASPAALANQALLLGDLRLHEAAASVAFQAALLFEEEGAARWLERDQALAVALGEDLRASRVDRVKDRLPALLDAPGSADAKAPFEILAARLAILEQQPAEAAERLGALRRAGGSAAELAGWLEVLALSHGGARSAASAVAEALPPSLARTLVFAVSLDGEQPVQGLILDLLPELQARGVEPTDRSLDLLARHWPYALPSLAWLSLHHHLADADRLRAAGQPGLAQQSAAQGVSASLRWQFLERRRQLLGRWPADGVPEATESWIADRVAGRLPADEAFLAVVPGAEASYLVLAVAGAAASSFGLAGEADLLRAVAAGADGLKSNDTAAVAAAGSQLGTLLLPPAARAELVGCSRWSLILPAGLAVLPPAIWVEDEILAGQPVPWLVQRRVLTLLAHAPRPGPAQADPARGGWAQAGAPVLDLQRSQLVVPALAQRYGMAALAAGGLRPRGEGDPTGAVSTGAALTTAGLAGLAAGAAVLELSVPAFGGGRLAGLLLSPDDEASRGDARVGVLPWTGLMRLDLPPLVLIDHSRFDPLDREWGLPFAAAACAEGGAAFTVLSRWPLPAQARERQIQAFAQALAGGVDPALALAQAQRAWLDAAAATGNAELLAPRQWAALTLWSDP